MKGSAFREFSRADGLPGSRVNCVREIDGRMMVGTSGGLAEWIDGKWVQPGFSRRLASKVVNVICQGNGGDLWVGSSSDPNGGLSRVHGDTVQVWRARDGLPHPYIQDILPVGDRGVWVATGQFEVGGAVLMETNQDRASIKKRLTKRDGLAGNKVRSLGLYEGGELWFGSENDGLAVFSPENSAVWTVKNGLPHNEVTAIRRDSEGNMWLTTLNGAVRIDRDAAKRMAEGARAE
jgi:ligand-binding sensor domain-containing protein